jgi:hypothetical protein
VEGSGEEASDGCGGEEAGETKYLHGSPY